MNLGVLLTPNTSVYEYGVGAPGNSGNRCCILGYYEAIMVQTLQALRYAPGTVELRWLEEIAVNIELILHGIRL